MRYPGSTGPGWRKETWPGCPPGGRGSRRWEAHWLTALAGGPTQLAVSWLSASISRPGWGKHPGTWSPSQLHPPSALQAQLAWPLMMRGCTVIGPTLPGASTGGAPASSHVCSASGVSSSGEGSVVASPSSASAGRVTVGTAAGRGDKEARLQLWAAATPRPAAPPPPVQCSPCGSKPVVCASSSNPRPANKRKGGGEGAGRAVQGRRAWEAGICCSRCRGLLWAYPYKGMSL